MLTKDSVTVSVDAVVYYRVSNATVSVANVEDAHSSTRFLQLFFPILKDLSFKVVGSDDIEEHSWDKRSSRDSQRQRKHLWFNAGEKN